MLILGWSHLLPLSKCSIYKGYEDLFKIPALREPIRAEKHFRNGCKMPAVKLQITVLDDPPRGVAELARRSWITKRQQIRALLLFQDRACGIYRPPKISASHAHLSTTGQTNFAARRAILRLPVSQLISRVRSRRPVDLAGIRSSPVATLRIFCRWMKAKTNRLAPKGTPARERRHKLESQLKITAASERACLLTPIYRGTVGVCDGTRRLLFNRRGRGGSRAIAKTNLLRISIRVE